MHSDIIQKAADSAKPIGKQKKTMADLIRIMEPEIEKALPAVITPERFSRMVLSAISRNQELAATTPNSFLGAMMTAAQLGLEPNTPLGEAYLIPYKNKGTLECQFQLGYKGMISLAYRSGEVSTIQAHAVHENDEWEYELGLYPKLRHIPKKSNRGDSIAYYAVVTMKDGGYCFAVMSIDDVREHAKRTSKSYISSNSPWSNYFDEMAKKTVLKKALKYAPMKSDFMREISQDETIKTSISQDMYEEPDETIYDIDYTMDQETEKVIKSAEQPLSEV